MEAEIARWEAARAALIAQMNGGGSHEELRQWAEALEAAAAAQEAAEMRWLELSERA